MKTLRQILFLMAIVVGVSVSVSAQKNDDKKDTPPKPKPPVIIVEPKKPKEKPPEDDKKKPEMALIVFSRNSELEAV